MTGKEQGAVKDNYNPKIRLEETTEGVFLLFSVDNDLFHALVAKPVDAARLGITKLSGYLYDYVNETPFILNKDYLGNTRSKQSLKVGPMELLQQGVQRIKVW